MVDSRTQEMSYGERIGSGGTDAILASFFREILLDFSIDVNRFQALLDRYIVQSGLASNTAEISTSRSALRRELMNMGMTWKVFIKGLLFLRIEEAELILTLFKDDDDQFGTSVYSYTFNVKEEQRRINKEDKDHNRKNTLATFFDQIKDGELEKGKELSQYFQKYVEEAKPGSRVDQQSSTKTSLARELGKKNISWKVFVKGLILLRARKIKIGLILTHQIGKQTYHEKIVVFK